MVDKLDVRLANDGSKREHPKENIEMFTSLIMSILNDPNLFQERIIVLTK